MACRVMRSALAVGLVVVLAGCWPMPGQGPDRRAYNPSEQVIDRGSVRRLAAVWRTTVQEPAAVGAPIVGPAGVYAAAGKYLYAFDRATGEPRWRYPDQDPIFAAGQPFLVGDAVLYSWAGIMGMMGQPIGGSAWVDAVTGASREGALAEGLVQAVREPILLVAEATGFVGYPQGQVAVVDGDAGTRWGALVYHQRGAFQPPTAGEDRWYHAGTYIDPEDVENPLPGVQAYPYAEPAMCSGALGGLRCPLWTTPTDSPAAASPVIGAGERSLYVVTEAGTFYALDPATGAVQWTAALGGTPAATPAVDRHTAFVPLRDGRVVGVPAAGCGSSACTPTWSAAVPGGGAGLQPAVAGGVVFVATDAGTVAAFPTRGCGRRPCRALWSDDLGAPATGAPAVTGGRLYVGTEAGELVAYAPR